MDAEAAAADSCAGVSDAVVEDGAVLLLLLELGADVVAG